jgi:hypothetical protein
VRSRFLFLVSWVSWLVLWKTAIFSFSFPFSLNYAIEALKITVEIIALTDSVCELNNETSLKTTRWYWHGLVNFHISLQLSADQNCRLNKNAVVNVYR